MNGCQQRFPAVKALMAVRRLLRKRNATVGLAAGVLVVACTVTTEPAGKPLSSPGPNPRPAAPTPDPAASTIVGRWDLLTLDHKPLPVEVGRTQTGQSVYAVEGHLVFAADGTYRRWTVTQAAAHRDSVIFVSSYVFDATATPSLTLRIDANNQGIGVLRSGILSLTYVDFLDWWDETLARAP